MNPELRLRVRMLRSSIFVLRLRSPFFVYRSVFPCNLMWGAHLYENRASCFYIPEKIINPRMKPRGARWCALGYVLFRASRAAARLDARSPLLWTPSERALLRAHLCTGSCVHLPNLYARSCAHFAGSVCAQSFCPGCRCTWSFSRTVVRLYARCCAPRPVLTPFFAIFQDGSLSSFSVHFAPYACVFPTTLHWH